jgi:hypothetical protein
MTTVALRKHARGAGDGQAVGRGEDGPNHS